MRNQNGQRGFSYIDVLIALVIMMIGLLASTAALTANLVRSYETEKQVIAKQIALSSIESIFSARDIARADSIQGWHSVGNVGTNPIDGTPRGIFLNGFNPIRVDLGLDGVAGTADDACGGGAPCPNAGGTSNASAIVNGFERRIVITDIEDPDRPSPPNAISRRRIDVTVRYAVNQLQREQTVSTIITNYAE